MSTNGLNATEDADMAECEEEKVVTMMDVLQEQQEFEEDANAVLGASDDKNCTYNKGYIKRQALYACLSCCADAKVDPEKRAGVCLACSLNCHENHELIELYTKRNFRCDCGNPKFGGHPCQFVPEKPDVNEDNSYNQNFSGVYCICHRPYPDPEATFEDEMIQCIVCEDWLHASHLESSLPTSEYAEMICKACMDQNEFLHDYNELAVNNESEDVDISSVNNVDTSITNNTSDLNGVFENVNGAGIAIDKVESVALENKIDVPKTEELAETPDKAETLPGPEENGVKPENTDVTPNETSIQTTSDSDNKGQENDECKNSIADSKTNNDISITNPENEDSNEENSENNSTETSTSVEKVMVTEDQSNSIIESIEKLESELGNLHSEQSETVAEIEKKDEKETNDQTAANDATDVAENSAVASSSEDKPESIECKVNEVLMNVENYSTKTESETNNSSEQEASETVQTGPNEVKALDSEVKTNESPKDIKRKLSTEDSEDVSLKKPKLDNCTRPKGVKRKLKGATFWPCNFRQKLCTCSECLSMYKDLSVLFLTDSEDTVTAYETLGKERIDGAATSQYEKGLEALSSLDRIQQINALTEYNKMRDKLLDYLKSFKDRKEIVKEEDIKAFFAGMKPKRESDGVYFCR